MLDGEEAAAGDQEIAEAITACVERDSWVSDRERVAMADHRRHDGELRGIASTL